MTFCTSKIDEAALDDPPNRVDWFRSVMGMLEIIGYFPTLVALASRGEHSKST